MITETITYLDYPDDNGVEPEVTETLRFSISTSELTENLTLVDQLQEVMRIVDTKEGTRTLEIAEVQKIIDFIKVIMQLAYGERTTDPLTGRKLFVKEGRWEVFKASRAYDKFLMHLFEDAERAMLFITRVMPKEIIEQAAEKEGIDKRVLTGEITFEEAMAAQKRKSEPHAMALSPEEKSREYQKGVDVVPLPEKTDQERYEELQKKRFNEITQEDRLFMMRMANRSVDLDSDNS